MQHSYESVYLTFEPFKIEREVLHTSFGQSHLLFSSHECRTTMFCPPLFQARHISHPTVLVISGDCCHPPVVSESTCQNNLVTQVNATGPPVINAMEWTTPQSICREIWVSFDYKNRTRLAVDRVTPWLTHIVCPWYHNDPIYDKDLGLLLKTRGEVICSYGWLITFFLIM